MFVDIQIQTGQSSPRTSVFSHVSKKYRRATENDKNAVDEWIVPYVCERDEEIAQPDTRKTDAGQSLRLRF